MKRIAAISLILAAGFLTAGSALAQTNRAVADIPFAFSLNGRTLPAGHYTIATDFNTPNVLRVEDRDDSVHIMMIALPGADESQKDNTLVFHKYGNQYFLTTIRANGSALNCHLATSKQEKWAKAQKQEASLRVDDNVMIPLQ
jgi:hypothetical protein